MATAAGIADGGDDGCDFYTTQVSPCVTNISTVYQLSHPWKKHITSEGSTSISAYMSHSLILFADQRMLMSPFVYER